MNNEIEQIAQQNDMSIEFVRWFFNEKKADCGEQWFLALGAMWEGWKAREGEVTALALTLEKSREASGCPDGVDLQDWVKQLAAENVGLKQQEPKSWYIRMTDEVTTDSGEAKMWRGVPLVMAGIDTPATDRIVAGIKADGVEEFAAYQRAITDEWACKEGHSSLLKVAESAEIFAKQLREGDDK